MVFLCEWMIWRAINVSYRSFAKLLDMVIFMKRRIRQKIQVKYGKSII